MDIYKIRGFKGELEGDLGGQKGVPQSLQAFYGHYYFPLTIALGSDRVEQKESMKV